MNTLKLVSILILLCGVLSFSGCLGDGGNTYLYTLRAVSIKLRQELPICL